LKRRLDVTILVLAEVERNIKNVTEEISNK